MRIEAHKAAMDAIEAAADHDDEGVTQACAAEREVHFALLATPAMTDAGFVAFTDYIASMASPQPSGGLSRSGVRLAGWLRFLVTFRT